MSANLTEIIESLGKVPHVDEELAFRELRKICSQHPNLRFLQWYVCRVCGLNRKVCTSPFLPDECICGKSTESKWEELHEE